MVVAPRQEGAADQGGWNIFITTSGGVGSSDPVLHTWIGAACDKGLFGWPCDPEIEKLRNAFGMAATEDERKKIAKELQTKAMEDVVYLPFGQWDEPLAYRADSIDGIVPNTGLTVLWGITQEIDGIRPRQSLPCEGVRREQELARPALPE